MYLRLMASIALAGLAASRLTTRLDGPVYSNNPPEPDITIVGDSLTLLSANEIIETFGRAGLSVAINAQSGRRSDQALEAIKSLPMTGRMVWALGTNDVALTNPQLNAAVQANIAAVGAQEIRWAVGYRRTDPTNSARVEGVSNEWDAATKQLVCQRWGNVVKATPRWIGEDGIHPSAEGRWGYAAFLLAHAARN
jgi:hypothetical protein